MSDQFSGWGSQPVPYSQEAEEATIGAIIIWPDLWGLVSTFLKADDFFLLRHRYIWQALNRLDERGDPIEYLTLIEELKNVGKLDEIGGPAYITQLTNSTPMSVHGEIYARLVERAATRRRLLAAADQIKALALDELLVVEDVLAQAEKKLREVSDRQVRTDTAETIGESMSIFFDEVAARRETKQVIGVPTGYTVIDDATGGLQPGDLTLLAARPSMGKTALALNIAYQVANPSPRLREKGYTPQAVYIASMEMNRSQVMSRFTAMAMYDRVMAEAMHQNGARPVIDTRTVQLGTLTAADWAQFVAVAPTFTHMPVTMDYAETMTPREVALKAGRVKDLRLLIVDGIWLMEDDEPHENERLKLKAISRKLKGLARALNCHVIGIHQLSRAVESRADKHPLLSDLRESGDLEAVADNVWFIMRPGYYDNAFDRGAMDFDIAKQRTGATGLTEDGLWLDMTSQRVLNTQRYDLGGL